MLTGALDADFGDAVEVAGSLSEAVARRYGPVGELFRVLPAFRRERVHKTIIEQVAEKADRLKEERLKAFGNVTGPENDTNSTAVNAASKDLVKTTMGILEICRTLAGEVSAGELAPLQMARPTKYPEE